MANKPRSDRDKNISRHGAVNPDDCEHMEQKYGWKLTDIEETNDPILEVDCVFEGNVEFPKHYTEEE